MYHYRCVRFLTLLFISMSFCIVSFAQDDWVSLFDGKTLDGWTAYSGFAKYAVVDGEIVGTAVPNSPNTFLCSNKKYSDFILEFDVFLMHEELNSGVQFRSIVPEEPTIFWFRNGDGQPSQKIIPAQRLYGYQVEIATGKRGTSGGVYDEGRRAFMIGVPTPGTAASKAFKDDQWNRYRVKCEGSSIQTWVNDIPCADFDDSMTARGVIGLQVHGVGDKTTPFQVKWRNIRIKEL